MKSLFESWRSFVNQNTVNEQLEVEPESVTNAASKIKAPDRDKKSTTSSSKAARGSSQEILRTIIKSKVPGYQNKSQHPKMEKRAVPLLPAFEEASAISGIPVQILISLAYEESKFDHKVYSNAKATGIMQLTPIARLQIHRTAVGYHDNIVDKFDRETTKCPNDNPRINKSCKRQMRFSKYLSPDQLKLILKGREQKQAPEDERTNILAGALFLSDIQKYTKHKTMNSALRYYNGGGPGVKGASKGYASRILRRAIEAGYKAK